MKDSEDILKKQCHINYIFGIENLWNILFQNLTCFCGRVVSKIHSSTLILTCLWTSKQVLTKALLLVRIVFYFSKKVRLFSQNDVLFLFYFLINPTMTTACVHNFFCKKSFIFQNCLFECIKSLKCYEMTRRCSHLPLCACFNIDLCCVPWSVQCKCALMQKQRQIINYLQFRDAQN